MLNEKQFELLLKNATDVFLGWELPDDFSPDCGIEYKKVGTKPIGTNLFTAQQAEKMFRYVLSELLLDVKLEKNKETEEKEKEIVARITHPSFTTTHYVDGSYRQRGDDWSVTGNICDYESIISVQLNQLKAKIFNLAEASFEKKDRSLAFIGLVKGFCNEVYSNLIKDMDSHTKRTGLYVPRRIVESEPLEQ